MATDTTGEVLPRAVAITNLKGVNKKAVLFVLASNEFVEESGGGVSHGHC